MSARVANWLNRKRVRRHALLLTVALWCGYLVNLATPGLIDRAGHLKGADFLHSYIIGSLALEHRSDALYDPYAQAAEGVRLVPQSAGVQFLPVYGPQYSLLCAPFARLPYTWAFVVWSLISAVLYAVCCYLIWLDCPALRTQGTTVALLAAGFPAFVCLIAFGQNSALALAAFTGCYFALKARRMFLAGVVLGLLAYKPQLGLVAAIVFTAAGEWRVIAGAIISVAAQVAIAAGYYGRRVLIDYAHWTSEIGSHAAVLEPKLYLMHSLRPFWNMLLPWHFAALGLYVVTAAVVITSTIWFWRGRRGLPLRFSLMLVASVLVAPHLTVYDLVIMAPALLFIADLAGQMPEPWRDRTLVLVYLSYWVAALGPLFRFIHLQVSVLVFAALFYCVAKASAEARPQPVTAGSLSCAE